MQVQAKHRNSMNYKNIFISAPHISKCNWFYGFRVRVSVRVNPNPNVYETFHGIEKRLAVHDWGCSWKACARRVSYMQKA